MRSQFSIDEKLDSYIGLTLLDENEVDSQKIEIAKFGEEHKIYKYKNRNTLLYYWYNNYSADFLNKTKEKSSEVNQVLKDITFWGVIIALIIGVVTAKFIFSYDGTSPINVLSVITFFVLIPLFLLLTFLAIQTLNLIKINALHTPIKLFKFAAKKINKKLADNFPEITGDRNFSRLTDFRLVDSVPIKLYLNKVIQTFAIAYILGALCWMLLNVITTDLAFSWSSTLNIEPQSIHNITTVISKPWESFLPYAVIDYETIEQTQYFRAESVELIERSSGEWWAFIILTIFLYGLTPRLIVFGFYNWKLRGAIDSQITDKRISNALITYLQKGSVDTTGQNVIQNYPKLKNGKSLTHQKSSCVIAWNLSDYSEEKLITNSDSNVLKFVRISNLDKQSKIALTIKSVISLLSNSESDLIVYVRYWESMNKRLEKILKNVATSVDSPKILIRPVYYNEDDDEIKKNKINWNARVDLINISLDKKIIFFEHANAVKVNHVI